MKKTFQILTILLLFAYYVTAQNNAGQIHGNFEINMQSYTADSLINAPDVPEKVRANTYANFTYTKDKFSAGVRYEAYLNTLLGYNELYNGHGIAYRYASYTADELEITAGNFYEQFGSGLILRTYEDKTLGYDNAFDGVRVKFKPINGIKITGLIGMQKKYFDYGPGIVRGVDGDFSVNNIFKKFNDSKTKISLGGSFVSKYQENNDPIYNYPENVGAAAWRFKFSRSGFVAKAEYAYKANDPSYDNLYDFEPDDGKNIKNSVFKDGNGFLLNLSYSQKGFGILLNAMRIDNMSFRSDRAASINDLNINYLTALSKNHAYSLAAMYPFSTQPNGQVGINTELFYKVPKKSLIGGKYGMHISLNFSQVNSIEKTDIQIDPELQGYTSNYFAVGDELYFRDYNIELYKKISKKLKMSLVYMHEDYNIEVIQGKTGVENISAEIMIADFTFKLNRKNAIRFEAEALLSEQYYGSWAMGMLEYTFSPNWFFSVSDQYNYGNPDEEHRIHYYSAYAGFVKGANRIQIGYGKQREGVMCVGGVCRNVPASNGFSLTITSTF